MSDYIERKSIRNLYSYLDPEDKVRVAQVLIDIDAIPSDDVVSVVRCKECKHRPIKEDADGDNYGFNVIAPNSEERCPCLVSDGWYSWIPDDNFYCGFGERKETDHE